MNTNHHKPLKNISDIPASFSDHPGSFGAIRAFDIHTGIDLYCNPNEPVFSITKGVVAKIVNFTGESAGSPWWNETKAIIIKDESSKNYILYGELEPWVSEGQSISPGELIGHVVTVLKKDKGKPMTMLHLEYYDEDFDLNPVEWLNENERPKHLKDPIVLLEKFI